ERFDVVVELRPVPRLGAERANAHANPAQARPAQRGRRGRGRRRVEPRHGRDPAVPECIAGARQRRSGAPGARPERTVSQAREGAASWGVRAATGAYTPSVSVSASWSGFTQKLSDINPTIAAESASAAANVAACQYWNTAWLNAGQSPVNCNLYVFTPAQEQAIRDQNAAYPFNFTPQPFQARLTISIPLWSNFSQPLQVSQAKAQQQD